MRKLAIIIAALGLTLGACDKKETPTPDGPAPIAAPADPTAADPAAADPTAADPTAAADPAAADPADPTAADPADPTVAADPTAAFDRVALVRDSLALYNDGKLEEAFAPFTDGVVRNTVGDPMMPVITGRDANVAFERGFLASFPDSKILPVRMFEAGDWVVAEVVMRGTHKAAFEGVPASDKPFGLHAALAFHFDADNRIDRMDVIADAATMMTQIGAFPSPTGEPLPIADAPTGEVTVVRGESNPENLALISKFYDEFIPDTREAAFERYLADDFLWSSPNAGRRIEGKAANMAYMQDVVFKVFADWTAKADMMLSVGDHVIAWAADSATYKAGEGEGTKIKTHGLHIFRIAGAKIAEYAMYNNGMELMAQLGPGAAGGDKGADAEGVDADDSAMADDMEAAKKEIQGAMDELDDAVKGAMDDLEKGAAAAADEMKAAHEEMKAAGDEANEELKKANEDLKKAMDDMP